MKKYICVRGWERNSKGDIVEEWLYNKYPEEVKERHFEIYNPVSEVVAPVVEKQKEEKPVETVKDSFIVETQNKRFKPFSIEDINTVDE